MARPIENSNAMHIPPVMCLQWTAGPPYPPFPIGVRSPSSTPSSLQLPQMISQSCNFKLAPPTPFTPSAPLLPWTLCAFVLPRTSLSCMLLRTPLRVDHSQGASCFLFPAAAHPSCFMHALRRGVTACGRRCLVARLLMTGCIPVYLPDMCVYLFDFGHV